MATDRVRAIQELRRSSAAQPRPGKRRYDLPWQDGDVCTCPCHRGPDHCAICTNDYADFCD